MFCWGVFSWWWVFPLIGMILCLGFCFFGMHRGGHHWCCGGRGRDAGLDELRREIRELKSRSGPAQ